MSRYKSQTREIIEKDPNYAPICLCCKMGKMSRIQPLYWRCQCGAEIDERFT